MPETAFPVPEGIFCLRCRYELRGLTSRACPECGRPFSTERPETYSRFATRQAELRHAILSAVPLPTNHDPNQSIPRLWQQIAHLLSENIDLRATVNALGQALIEKGILQNDELKHRLERLDLFEPGTNTMTEEDVLDSLNNPVPPRDDSTSAP